MKLKTLRRLFIAAGAVWAASFLFGADAQIARDILAIVNFFGIATVLHILTNVFVEVEEEDEEVRR